MKKKIIKYWVVLTVLFTNVTWVVWTTNANSWLNNWSINSSISSVQWNQNVSNETNSANVDVSRIKKNDNSQFKRKPDNKINKKKRRKLIMMSHSINKLKREIERNKSKKLDNDKLYQELWDLENVREHIRSKVK